MESLVYFEILTARNACTEKNFRRLIYSEIPLIIEKSVYLRNQP